MRLEKQFPINLVFQQIYNEGLAVDMRSIFCDLAYTLYIDHDPLNQKVVPNLCRVFKSNHFRNQPSLLTSNDKVQSLDQENFLALLENLMRMTHVQKNEISKHLQGKCKKASEDQPRQIKGTDFLNNILLANVTRLLSKMVSIDLLTILNKSENYYRLVSDFIHVLEYDKNNANISYALAMRRGKILLICS